MSKIGVYFSDMLRDLSPRWVQKMVASAALTASAIHAIANERPEFEAEMEKNVLV